MIDYLSRPRIPSRLLLAAITAVLVSSCSTRLNVTPKVKGLPRLTDKNYVSYDSDQFGYRKWLSAASAKKDPATVIIGVHGISGHSGDYENFGKHLLKHHSDVALYAPETRGQGMDQNKFRRGDIRRVKEWYKDLYTFTRLVRKVHPKSKIVWFGESMGSLIVMHAYSNTPPGEVKPDALVISSPIVEVEEKLPAWKMATVRVSTLLLPKLRVSLDTLSDGQRAVVTEDDIHEEQVAKNPWYIRRYTLRLLLSLGDMAGGMDGRASQVHCPVLVLHGGKDIFTEEKNVNDFYERFPDTTDKTKKYYPGSYHLLMYDHDRDKIFKDVSTWLNQLDKGQKANK
jgi:alpha-beta hydrolase superfamily lysophospholipase